ncbi:MAG: hypothetical protein KBD90_03285 [Alphaproteobacteria bacterium]|nr:hypothetical protein [Alphaproteobacteria bacterium]
MIKDIAKFLEASADSINRRQEIFESLMRATEAYMGFALSKENLEQQLKSLSIDLSNCNSSRRRYLKLFSESINPFEAPEIAEKFKKLVEHDRLISRHSIDPQEENQRRKDLCDLCQTEVNKVNNQLVRILNPQ